MGDYYQGVVDDYLRADRSMFINTECFIQIKPGAQPPKGSSWYCDAIAVDFEAGSGTIFLCEVTYSTTLQALMTRLRAWNDCWEDVRTALARDSHLPAEWRVRPWIFVPEKFVGLLLKKLDEIGGGPVLRFTPRISTLEMVQPWNYCTYDRDGERLDLKPTCIPPEWQN